jgi:RNA polymerase-binding transcription factor DksA
MCDEIDQLTDRATQEAEVSRRAHAIEEAYKMSQPPAEFCSDCEAAINPTRQAMRCTRCVDCQTDYERRRKLFGKGIA